jgi:VWFA-related protein
LLCAIAASAQQTTPAPAAPPTAPAPASPTTAPKTIALDVVVTPKSGPPAAGLTQQDFTLLDNGAPQPLTSFQALGDHQDPIEVIFVIDAVDTSYSTVAYAREQIDKFLLANGGRLTHPTTLAFFNDTGVQMQQDFSTDGRLLSASLDRYTVALRSLRRSAGFYGATDRFALAINAMHMLIAHEAPHPGRKLLIWVSPGWPLLSGPNIYLDSKQQRGIFSDIVGLSTGLREARITLYSVDPLGAADSGSSRNFYYQSFLKGVKQPSQTAVGDISLQVLATQTGGLVLNSNNAIAALLDKCLADTDAYYQLSFRSAPAEHPDQYHHLEVRVSKPGLTPRTRTVYYAQP